MLFRNLNFYGFIIPIFGVFLINIIEFFIKKKKIKNDITSSLSLFFLFGSECLNLSSFQIPILPLFLLIYFMMGLFLLIRIYLKNKDIILKKFIILMWRLLFLFSVLIYLISLVLWLYFYLRNIF